MSPDPNAVVETFFKTIKSELIWRTVFMSRSQAETALAYPVNTLTHNM